MNAVRMNCSRVQVQLSKQEKQAISTGTYIHMAPTPEVIGAWKFLEVQDKAASRIKDISMADNLGAFGGVAYGRKNFGVVVDIALERDQDVYQGSRQSYAKKAKETLETKLKEVFPAQLEGDPELEVILRVRIIVCSDGSHWGRCSGTKFSAGHAKLALVWCLQSVRTGKVAAARRVFQHEGRPAVCNLFEDRLLLKMANQMSTNIIRNASVYALQQ